MKGGVAQPTALKILRGNPGKRALPVGEPMPAAVSESDPPPAWLDAAAKKEWRRLAPLLLKNGVLTEMDVDALCAYCVAWCTWRAANREIRKGGMVIKSQSGYPMPNPHISISNRAMQTMRQLMASFGMTPSSRTRVTRSDAQGKAADPLARFLKR